jgi:hypothetical protein
MKGPGNGASVGMTSEGEPDDVVVSDDELDGVVASERRFSGRCTCTIGADELCDMVDVARGFLRRRSNAARLGRESNVACPRSYARR